MRTFRSSTSYVLLASRVEEEEDNCDEGDRDIIVCLIIIIIEEIDSYICQAQTN